MSSAKGGMTPSSLVSPTALNAAALPGATQPRASRQAQGSSACPHSILCSSASLVTLCLSRAFPHPQTRCFSGFSGLSPSLLVVVALGAPPGPPHKQGCLSPAPVHAGCRRLSCAPLWKPSLSQWESLHPKMPRKLLTIPLHLVLAHSQ